MIWICILLIYLSPTEFTNRECCSTRASAMLINACIRQANLVPSAQYTRTYHPPSTETATSSQRDSLSPKGAFGSPSDLALFSQSFPFTPFGRTDDVQKMIESHLPPHDKTLALCHTYFEQAGWLFRGVRQQQVFDDMIPALYHQAASPRSNSSSTVAANDYGGPHDLALLFIILAVGSLVQPEHEHENEPHRKSQQNALAEHYHQISRAAISLQPIMEKPSIVTIQTLHLLSIYNAMSGTDMQNDTSMEMTWSLVTMAAHLSQTIGLRKPFFYGSQVLN